MTNNKYYYNNDFNSCMTQRRVHEDQKGPMYSPLGHATILSSKVQYFIWSINEIFEVGSGQE